MTDAPQQRPRLHTLLVDLPPLALALGLVVLMGQTFAARVGFPYDLEWMEGGMLLHGLRVSEGLPLYVTPSPDFIPFIYPPLYSWVLGALGAVFGLDYALGRAVSFLGTLVGAGALVAAVRGERGSWALALAGAALFLSGYDESGGFYDLVRIDGLLIGLWAWSLVAARRGWVRAAGVLLCLAYATKHNAALFGLPILVWTWKTRGRADALRFAAWSVLPALAFTGGMLLEGDGLFLTYLLGVPSGHPFVLHRFFPLAEKELFMALPWTTAACVAVAVAWRRRWTTGGAFWVANGVVAVILCAVMRGHHGGFKNVLIPGLWTLALWGVLALSAVQRRWPMLWVRGLVGVLVAFQLWWGRWELERYTPTDADRRAGARVIAELAAVEGEVLAPWSPWYPVMAGKRPGFHLIGLWDVDHDGGPLKASSRSVDTAIAEGRWAAILTASDKLGHGLKDHYRKGDRVLPPGKSLLPKTGWRVRPKHFWYPLAPGDDGAAGR